MPFGLSPKFLCCALVSVSSSTQDTRRHDPTMSLADCATAEPGKAAPRYSVTMAVKARVVRRSIVASFEHLRSKEQHSAAGPDRRPPSAARKLLPASGTSAAT